MADAPNLARRPETEAEWADLLYYAYPLRPMISRPVDGFADLEALAIAAGGEGLDEFFEIVQQVSVCLEADHPEVEAVLALQRMEDNVRAVRQAIEHRFGLDKSAAQKGPEHV